MNDNIKFKHLEKENNEIRAKINDLVLNFLDASKQELLIVYINNLIENELLQEGLSRK